MKRFILYNGEEMTSELETQCWICPKCKDDHRQDGPCSIPRRALKPDAQPFDEVSISIPRRPPTLFAAFGDSEGLVYD